MRLYAAAGEARLAAHAQVELAFALAQMGEFDAAGATIAEALATARAVADACDFDVANALNARAMIAKGKGDTGAAQEDYAEALALCKSRGDESMSATVLANLAELEFADGHPEQALRFIGEASEIVRERKNTTDSGIDYVNTAAYRLALSEPAGARESARDGLRVARQGRDEPVIAIALQHLALLATLGGESQRAATLLGYVDARYADLGIKREYTEQWGYDKLLAALRETLTEDEIAQLSAEGAMWSEDRAVEEALQA